MTTPKVTALPEHSILEALAGWYPDSAAGPGRQYWDGAR